LRDERLIVVALGGNAFQSRGDRGSPREYWANAYKSAEIIVDLVELGYKVVVTHGNGPQVGVIDEWMFLGLKMKGLPPMTLDIAGAMSQGWLGYILQQAVYNKLVERGLLNKKVRGVVSLITQTLVDKNDPDFKDPSKYIGPWYEKEEAEKMSREYGWIFKQDPRGGFRRVVPSPDPVRQIELEAAKTLINNDFIVILSGGGGVPVYINERGFLEGVEAVVDKDLAAERIATSIRAGILMILTDVDKVYLNYGRPDAKPIDMMTLSEAKRYYAEGHFKPGSMGPKILAAIRFIENGGLEAIIAHLNKAREAVEKRSGTRVVPDHILKT